MSVVKKNTKRDTFSRSQFPAVISNNSQRYKDPSSSSATIEEEERKRLSRELHDGLGQLLTTIGLQVQQCLERCDINPLPCPSPQEHKASLQQISVMVKEAIGEVRSICSAIRPAILDDLGILAAISWLCRQISQASPSLSIVTDYRMSILGGEYWVKFLEKYCRETKIVITSGFLKPDFTIPFEVVFKPYDYGDLEQKIAAYLKD